MDHEKSKFEGYPAESQQIGNSKSDEDFYKELEKKLIAMVIKCFIVSNIFHNSRECIEDIVWDSILILKTEQTKKEIIYSVTYAKKTALHCFYLHGKKCLICRRTLSLSYNDNSEISSNEDQIGNYLVETLQDYSQTEKTGYLGIFLTEFRATLKPQGKQFYDLYHIEGYNYKEISLILDVAEPTLRQRNKRICDDFKEFYAGNPKQQNAFRIKAA